MENCGIDLHLKSSSSLTSVSDSGKGSQTSNRPGPSAATGVGIAVSSLRPVESRRFGKEDEVDLKEALTTSINYKQKVRDHYAKGAQEILSPKGKKVFATLAKEEQGHLSYLKSRLAEWHASGKVSSPDLPTLLPSVNWIEEARARVARGPAGTIAVQGELDLLKIALDLERQTSGFYRQLVDTLKSEEREMFARFLEIEQGHLAIVQAEIDALAGNSNWFDVMEIQLEAS